MHPDGTRALITGIIADAIRCYDSALRYMEKHPFPPEGEKQHTWYSRKNTIDECEQFFRGEWFAFISDLDGEAIIRGLRNRDRKKKLFAKANATHY